MESYRENLILIPVTSFIFTQSFLRQFLFFSMNFFLYLLLFLTVSFPFYTSVFVCPQYLTSSLVVIFLEPRSDGDATLICLSVRTECFSFGYVRMNSCRRWMPCKNVKCVRWNKQDGRVSSSAGSLVDRFVCGSNVFPDAVVCRVHVAFSKQGLDCVILCQI